jgi:hypothetical protein
MDLPLGRSDLIFRDWILTYTLLSKGQGRCMRNIFWRKRLRTDQRWDEGVRAGGGQPGSTARARHSLVIVSHVRFESPLGVSLRATQDGGGSQPEERHGLAAKVHKIYRHRENPVHKVFGKLISLPNIF